MINSDKDKIVKCAKDIIAECGVKSLSVSKIAAQCKMSKSTFYKMFSSKKELMMYLSEEDNNSSEFLSIKEKIITTAIKEFSKNTFNEIDMASIAELAGINRSSIYRYFANKEELLEVSILNELKNRKKYIEAIKNNESDPLVFVDKYMDYFDSYANNDYTSLLYATMIYYSKNNIKIKEYFDSLREYTVMALVNNFEDGKKKGIFKDNFDSITTSQMFFAVMSGMNVYLPSSFLYVSRKFLDMLYSEIRM
jgi:AcrR family transcriptional regulator